MGLFDVFRPRWKHSNPEVRLEAVKSLDDDESLAQAASRDDDERIRRLAIRQLIDPWRLQNVASVQSDEKLRSMALGRARELFVEIALSAKETERSALAAVRDLDSQEHLADIAIKASRAAVRTQALDLVVAKGALVSIVRRSTDAELRRSAMARIKDSETLKSLAYQEKDPQFAALLLAQLGQGDLVEVAQKARHKPVAKLARQRAALDEAKPKDAAKPKTETPPADLEALKRNARQFQLAREFEALADRAAKGDEEDGLRAGSMQTEWAEIGSDAEIGVRVRIENSMARWTRVHEAAAETKRKAEEKQAASRASLRARELTERMSAPEAVPPVRAPGQDRSAGGNSAGVEAQGQTTNESVEGEERRTATERPSLTPEMIEAETGALQLLKGQLQVAAASDRLRLLDAGLKELRNVDRRLSRLPETVRDALAAEFAELKAALTRRLGEVKQGEEWKRWVAVQRLEKLCVQIEVLRDVLPQFPDKEQAPVELANLKAEWRKSVGPVHPAKRDELWNRFRAAGDAVMDMVVKSRPGAEEEPSAAAEETTLAAPEQSTDATPEPRSEETPG